MKITKYLLIAILTVVTFSACKQSDKKTESTEVILPVKLETVSLDIEGMTCEIGCAKTIESRISKLEGVTESKVDFENTKGTFTYDANKTSEAKIISTINGLLDGKIYRATKGKTCCTVKKEEIKSCTQACAEKCGHKVGETCDKCKVEKKESCCVEDKPKDCSTECAEKCDHKDGETCAKCSAKTEVCNPGCKKPCCTIKNE